MDVGKSAEFREKSGAVVARVRGRGVKRVRERGLVVCGGGSHSEA